jgi:hypothetical protein
LNYIHWKKTFEIVPMNDVDSLYVLNRIKEREERLRLNDLSDEMSQEKKNETVANESKSDDDYDLTSPASAEGCKVSLNGSNKRNRRTGVSTEEGGVRTGAGTDVSTGVSTTVNTGERDVDADLLAASLTEDLHINRSMEEIGQYIGKRD